MVAEREGRREFEIVLGGRQLATTLFILLMQMGVVACVAYMAGKAVAAAQYVRTAPASAPVSAPLQPAVKPVESPAPVATPPAAAPPATLESTPAAGLYLQIASVNLGVAEVFTEGLRIKGFDARFVPGASPEVFRVLVGPLGPSNFSKTQKSLEDAGFSPFPRRY